MKTQTFKKYQQIVKQEKESKNTVLTRKCSRSKTFCTKSLDPPNAILLWNRSTAIEICLFGLSTLSVKSSHICFTSANSSPLTATIPVDAILTALSIDFARAFITCKAKNIKYYPYAALFS